MTPKSMHRVRLSPPYFLFFRKFSILFLCCQVFFEEGILPLRFAQKKEGILRSLTLPQNDRIKNSECQSKRLRMTPNIVTLFSPLSPFFLLCHPFFSFVTLRRKPKGLHKKKGFFPFASLRKKKGFFGRLRYLRMTE